MPRFFVLSGPDLGRTFDLEEGAVFGRSPDCAAPLRASSVSRNHARLEREGEGWVLVDLGSRNGIHGGGARTERLALEDGAVFLLGEVELRFRAQAEAPSKPVAIPPPPAAEPPPARVDERRASPAPAAVPRRDDEIDEIELEEVVLDEPAPPRPRPATRPASAPLAPTASPSPSAPSAPRGAGPEPARAPAARANAPARGGVELRDAGRPVLQYSRVPAARGFALSDLAQQPSWVKLVVALFATALFVALFYLAFRGTLFVRGRVQGEPAEFDAPPG